VGEGGVEHPKHTPLVTPLLCALNSFSFVTIRLDALYPGIEPKVSFRCSPPLIFILLSQTEHHTIKFSTHSAAFSVALKISMQLANGFLMFADLHRLTPMISAVYPNKNNAIHMS